MQYALTLMVIYMTSICDRKSSTVYNSAGSNPIVQSEYTGEAFCNVSYNWNEY